MLKKIQVLVVRNEGDDSFNVENKRNFIFSRQQGEVKS